MIRPLDTSLLDSVQKPASTSNPQPNIPTSGKDAFASQLERAAAQKSVDSGPTTANRAAPAEGEKWKPVEGRDDYAEIISGDRKGLYVNLNRGGRKGEAFSIEEQDGKTFHVYKREGKEDLRIEVDGSEGAVTARKPTTAPSKNETWAPVSGTSSYADILSGSRNGYYVNISQGSSREGQAFHIVKQGDKTFHVYGDGKDAVRVEVGKTKKKDDDAKTSETGSTGGTSTQPTSGAADTGDATSTGGTSATGSVGKPVI